ncbi:MAG: HEAT repeat domain-containing protein [Candidatus Heimdallarchaeota archaeon]
MTNNSGKQHSQLTDDELLALLESNIRANRIKVIHYLVETKSPQSIDILSNLSLTDPDHLVREIAIIGLSNFQFEKYQELFAKIYNSYEERKSNVKARAIWALGKKDSLLSFNTLMKGLRDESIESQYWSIHGLLNQTIAFPFKEIESVLVSNKNQLVRQTITWALGIIKEKDSVKILIDALLKDKDAHVRMNAAWSLRNIRDPRSISGLCYALKNEFHELTKRQIVLTIGHILNQSKAQSEIDSNEIDNIRKEATLALSHTIQRDTCYYVRRACAEALGKIANKEAIPVLIQTYASDVNQFVRIEIANTLRIFGDERALPVLRKSLRSHYKQVKQAAKDAIEQIESKQ